MVAPAGQVGGSLQCDGVEAEFVHPDAIALAAMQIPPGFKHGSPMIGLAVVTGLV
jgi:hypothetical protein